MEDTHELVGLLCIRVQTEVVVGLLVQRQVVEREANLATRWPHVDRNARLPGRWLRKLFEAVLQRRAAATDGERHGDDRRRR